MAEKRGTHKLSQEAMQSMIQKLIREKCYTIQYLARQLRTQPRVVELVLSGKGEFKTKKTQMALVKLFLSNIAR
jgi:hypothetical protein